MSITYTRALVMTIAAILIVPDGFASPACERRVNNTPQKIQQCVTLEGVRRHQAALQSIADANGGNRASGTSGYDESVVYVATLMQAAGYVVSIQPFEHDGFITLSPTLLEQVEPQPGGSIQNRILEYSGSGDVTASVTHISNFALTPGCEAADFAGFPAGNIALIQRGSCLFKTKAENAYDAGAVGVVIYNNVSGELSGTLSDSFTLEIPVTGVTQDVGLQLANTAGLVLRLRAETQRGLVSSFNLLAESRAGNANNVIMVGAHLDSVIEGPGIQDNGSGVAALLEAALQMARVKPDNKVRFAWWGANESSFPGSDYYLDNLSDAERAQIALYLNFDSIASPNYVRFIYDGDGSNSGVAGPVGSAAIEAFFEDFYTGKGLAFEEISIDFSSDHMTFSDYEIPIGGLFTGSTGIKTPQQAAIFGGVAGQQYDPCYHQACDTYDNVNQSVLDVNADAAAAAIIHFSVIPE